MKPIKSAILCATLAPCLAFAAESAQDRGVGQDRGIGSDHAQHGQQANRQQSQLDTTADGFLRSAPQQGVSMDSLIGSSVVSRVDGEDIGNVEDILIDRDGNALGVIVSVGGFLGMGAKDVALDWDSVSLTHEGDDGGIMGGGAGDTNRAARTTTTSGGTGSDRDGAAATDRDVSAREGLGQNRGMGQDRDDDNRVSQGAASPDDYKLVVDISREALENAPEFDRNW